MARGQEEKEEEDDDDDDEPEDFMIMPEGLYVLTVLGPAASEADSIKLCGHSACQSTCPCGCACGRLSCRNMNHLEAVQRAIPN